MNKVYLVYVHSNDTENEIFDASVCSTLELARKQLIKIVEDFKQEIMSQYDKGAYEIMEADNYFYWFAYSESRHKASDNFYHVFIKECEVIIDECSN